ncbi:MAG TPA: ABC transporter permease [Acidimicrobiia bacterium]|nr:ABC transporter permease [Acidimicrobiia bacterium]
MSEVVEEENARQLAEHIAPAIRYRALRRYTSNVGAVFGAVYIFLLVVVCVFPRILTKYPQNDIDLLRPRIAPSGEHWLGTDQLGRDVLSELLHAGLISLRIALGVAILSTLIGATLGAIAGYKKGWLDSFIMRSTDLFLVIPQIVILAISLKKYRDGGDIAIVVVLALVFWMSTARYVRGQVLSLRTREYVDAAKISGRRTMYIVFRHLIPNSWSIIAVSSVLAVANAILTESTLSFLGLGVKPPETSWGLMLENARANVLGEDFHLVLAPGLAIFLTVLAFNFIGDGLRDALDPRSEQS